MGSSTMGTSTTCRHDAEYDAGKGVNPKAVGRAVTRVNSDELTTGSAPENGEDEEAGTSKENGVSAEVGDSQRRGGEPSRHKG